MLLNSIFKPSKSKQIEDLKYEVLHLRSELKRQIDFDRNLQVELNKYRNSKTVRFSTDDEIYKINQFIVAVMKSLTLYEVGNGKYSAELCIKLLKTYFTEILEREWYKNNLADEAEDIVNKLKDINTLEEMREYLKNHKSK